MIAKKTKSPQEAAGHNSVPSNKPHYCVPGCNFLWKASGKFQWWKKSKREKLTKWKKMKNVWTTKKDQDTIVYPDTMTQLCILTQF